jgi:hypothetical protein
MGEDPATAVDARVQRAMSDLVGVEDRLIAVTAGMGIWLSNYLPTRTFELVVHGFDIARVAGIHFEVPSDALAEATVLAARTAVTIGQAETVLLSLTGRTSLPSPFSVV